MKNEVRKHDAPRLRQNSVDAWFKKFVEHELYDEDQYHEFCRIVKNKTQFEIERLFRLEYRKTR